MCIYTNVITQMANNYHAQGALSTTERDNFNTQFHSLTSRMRKTTENQQRQMVKWFKMLLTQMVNRTSVA